jgi:hypothetical protein
MWRRAGPRTALALDDACRVLGKQGWQRAVGEVHPQQLTPEVHRVANGSRRQLVDVFEDEVLGLVLAACRLQLGLVGMKQPGKMLRLDLLHRAVSQPGEKLGKAEPNHTTVVHDVPRQLIRVGAAQMQNQRRRWPRLTAIPCGAIALLVFRTEGERVFVQHHLEAPAAQLGQQLLVEQHIVGVARHPQPGEIGREVAENAF